MAIVEPSGVLGRLPVLSNRTSSHGDQKVVSHGLFLETLGDRCCARNRPSDTAFGLMRQQLTSSAALLTAPMHSVVLQLPLSVSLVNSAAMPAVSTHTKLIVLGMTLSLSCNDHSFLDDCCPTSLLCQWYCQNHNCVMKALCSLRLI